MRTEPGVDRPHRAIRLLVVDDHPVVVDGVALLVAESPWIEVAGSAITGRDAITVAARVQPDVVLLDLCLSDMLGSEVVAEVAHCAPRAAVVVFTAFPEHAALDAARAAGAVGLVIKDASRSDLVAVVTGAARGERLSWSTVHERTVTAGELARTGLTRREHDVLRHVARGETNREIAGAMYLSPNTVKTYLQSALVKLGARNRVEAIARAHDHGLL